jgi:hypothetical protein
LAFLSEKPVGVLTDGNMQERRRVTAIWYLTHIKG